MTIANNQLRFLIAQYEDEKKQLQKYIDNCLAEEEYLLAHYYLQALYQLCGRLRTLNNIEDKLYDEKELVQRSISRLEKSIGTESRDYMKEFYTITLQQAKEKLEELNEISKKSEPPVNPSILDETLERLAKKEIKNLKLTLKKTDKLFLNFAYSSQKLKVTLPYIKYHIKRWKLDDENINSFQKLGFSLSKNETKLMLTLTGEKEEALRRLKIILAKIVFEIFYFKEFENDSYIQFTERIHR